MKYALTLTVDDRAAGMISRREKLVLWAHPSELAWHIALKLVSYILFLEARPQVERSVGFRFKPDLASVDAAGRVTLWVDCGNVAVKKVQRVAGWLRDDARFVIVRREERDGQALAEAIAGNGALKHSLELLWFDIGFVDGLADLLDASNALSCVRSPGRIDLTLANRGGEYAMSSALYTVRLGT